MEVYVEEPFSLGAGCCQRLHLPGLFERRDAWLQQHRSVNALRAASE